MCLSFVGRSVGSTLCLTGPVVNCDRVYEAQDSCYIIVHMILTRPDVEVTSVKKNPADDFLWRFPDISCNTLCRSKPCFNLRYISSGVCRADFFSNQKTYYFDHILTVEFKLQHLGKHQRWNNSHERTQVIKMSKTFTTFVAVCLLGLNCFFLTTSFLKAFQ